MKFNISIQKIINISVSLALFLVYFTIRKIKRFINENEKFNEQNPENSFV